MRITHKLSGGFSLVEMLVVVIILSILVGFALFKYTGITDSARVSGFVQNFESIERLYNELLTNGFLPEEGTPITLSTDAIVVINYNPISKTITCTVGGSADTRLKNAIENRIPNYQDAFDLMVGAIRKGLYKAHPDFPDDAEGPIRGRNGKINFAGFTSTPDDTAAIPSGSVLRITFNPKDSVSTTTGNTALDTAMGLGGLVTVNTGKWTISEATP